jgi:hypothetical protein
MSREPRREQQQQQQRQPDPEQPAAKAQPKRKYAERGDFMSLLRHRLDFGSRHNAQAYWAEYG